MKFGTLSRCHFSFSCRSPFLCVASCFCVCPILSGPARKLGSSIYCCLRCAAMHCLREAYTPSRTLSSPRFLRRNKSNYVLGLRDRRFTFQYNCLQFFTHKVNRSMSKADNSPPHASAISFPGTSNSSQFNSNFFYLLRITSQFRNRIWKRR